MSKSFDKLKTQTASTLRQGAVSGGLAGDMATKISSLDCMPIDPITAELAQVAGLDTWVGLHQTMTDNLDILAGDQFVSGGVTYNVRAVESWSWRPDDDSLLVVLEKVA